MKNTLIMLFCLGWLNLLAGDKDFTGQVVTVLDGNTLEIKSTENDTIQVLLYGIDSPEPGQPYAEEARQLLEKKLLKKKVTVQVLGRDRKGNYLAVVLTEKNADARIDLLQEGLAWTVEKNPLKELESHRVIAQQKGKGLWKEKEPTPPWIYRRQQSMTQPKSS